MVNCAVMSQSMWVALSICALTGRLSVKAGKNRKEAPMNTVASKDGTPIAFDRLGDGPPVILVCGGSVDRMSNAPLADLLAAHFTVYNYDRRGRGDSGDTAHYAIEREFEDIAALIQAAGGSAFLYGTSSGAALALHAAASGLPVAKLALWEPPFILEGSRPRPPADTARVYRELVAQDRRGDAVEYFMAQVVGLPPEFVAFARSQPWWPAQEAIAHTLAYDATVMGDYSLPADVAVSITTPTLVVAGGEDFSWMRETAKALGKTIPNAEVRILEGQQHNVDPTVLAPALVEFFKR
jgi:pimeloyl-ACP methyl ester carboxylesterase